MPYKSPVATRPRGRRSGGGARFRARARARAHLHDVAGAPGDAAEVDGPGVHGSHRRCGAVQGGWESGGEGRNGRALPGADRLRPGRSSTVESGQGVAAAAE